MSSSRPTPGSPDLISTREENAERLSLALEAARLGMWDWDIESGKVFVSQDWSGILGYGPDESVLHDQTWHGFIHPEDLPRVLEEVEAHLRGDSPCYEAEYRLLEKSGEWRWIQDRGRITARDAAGLPLRMTGVHQDVTERKAAEERILFLAQHDALTGLPNRVLLYDRLQQALARAVRRRGTFAVLFIDLDGFKTINDQHGHAVGDLFLQQVALRLTGALRAADTVSRLGGDEFIVLLDELTRPEDAALVAQKLIRELSCPCILEGKALGSTPSIGISCFPDDGADPEALIQCADQAMYRAKAAGPGRFEAYAGTVQDSRARSC
ncbi:sensor domain-containing diguanylate cyclase [Thermithiobacillus plumbiphilus]|uniref:Sensor domain-containing diguanylate cyclase n=1 Tax=Thermithiobacillus plumbiphilus TaxID=1729899 RepID=A0ABU9D816_9PROT